MFGIGCDKADLIKKKKKRLLPTQKEPWNTSVSCEVACV